MPRPLGKYELFFGMNLTEEQEAYVDSIFDNQITFVNAMSGSGKTTLAVASARILKDINPEIELMYLFSPVEEGKMGFRPGTQQVKELAYRQPLIDALIAIGENPLTVIKPFEEEVDMLTKIESDIREELEQQIRGKKKHKGKVSNSFADRYWVEAKSHTFMRGTNQPNKVIIIDEGQNWTHGELKKTLTRVHNNSKVIVIGHDGQCDLKNPKDSGFVDFIDWFSDRHYCGVHTLTKNFRGPLAQHADNFKKK